MTQNSRKVKILILAIKASFIVVTVGCATTPARDPIDPNKFYVVKTTPDKSRPILGEARIEKHLTGVQAKSKINICDGYLHKGFMIEVFDENTLKPVGASPYLCK